MSYINTYVKGKVDLLADLPDASGFLGSIVSPAGLITPVFQTSSQAKFFLNIPVERQAAYEAASVAKFGDKVTAGHLRALRRSVQVRKGVVKDRLFIGQPGACPEVPPETVMNSITSCLTGVDAPLRAGFTPRATDAAESYLERSGCIKLFSTSSNYTDIRLPGLLYCYTGAVSKSVWLPPTTMANIFVIDLSPYSTTNFVTGLRYDVGNGALIAERYTQKMRRKNMENTTRWGGAYDKHEWRPNGWERTTDDIHFGRTDAIGVIEEKFRDGIEEGRRQFDAANQVLKDFGFEDGWNGYVTAARRLKKAALVPGNELLCSTKSSVHFWGDVIGYANPVSSATPLQIWDAPVRKKHPLEGRIKILPEVQGLKYTALHGIADLYEWAKHAELPEEDLRKSLENPTRVMMYNCPRGFSNRGHAAETELAKEIARNDGDWEDLELESESFPNLKELDKGNAKQSLRRPVANWLQVPSTCYSSHRLTARPGARTIYVTVESERYKVVLKEAVPEVPAVMDPNDDTIELEPRVPAVPEVWEYRYRHSFKEIDWGQQRSSLEEIKALARDVLDDEAARIYFSETAASISNGYGSNLTQTVRAWASEQLEVSESRLGSPPEPVEPTHPDYVEPAEFEDFMAPWATAMMGHAYGLIPPPSVTNKPETRLMRTMFGGVDQEHLCVSIVTGGIPLQTVQKSTKGM